MKPNYYGTMPESEILKRKTPNVFIYQQIIDEYGIYEVRVGCGWEDDNLPPFKIPFRMPDGDFIMVKPAKTPCQKHVSPSVMPPQKAKLSQAEMAL